MMRKITSLLACVALVAMSAMVSAQGTKVTKQIKAFDWLDVAVVDGNQVEGGLHVYADWADVTANLKLKQTKIGMMVALTGAEAGTYRLATWAVNTAPPVAADFVRVGESILAADIAARDAYTDAAKAYLAEGTLVIVQAGTSGLLEQYVYIGGATAADAIDDTKCWLALTNTSGMGFIAYGEGAVAYDAAGVDKTGTVVALDMTDRTNGIGQFVETSFALTDGNGTPFISFPQAWNKPTFYVSDGTNEFNLNDCWTVTYVDQGGVMYQEWTANVDFAAGSTGLSLVVR